MKMTSYAAGDAGDFAFTPDGTRLLTAGGGPPRLRRVTWLFFVPIHRFYSTAGVGEGLAFLCCKEPHSNWPVGKF